MSTAAKNIAAREDGERLKMDVLGDTVGFMVRVVQVQIFQAYYERFGKSGPTTG